MARKKYYFSEIAFDSQEEIDFCNWLLEAKKLNLIYDFEYQPKSFQLANKVIKKVPIVMKTKTKWVDKTILQPHIYTADFKILFTDLIYYFDAIKLKNLNILQRKEVYVDIKGGFNTHSSHSNFSVESKWIWAKYGILVERVIPDKFFKTTWIPEYCRYTPVKKDLRKKYLKYPTFEQITIKINSILKNKHDNNNK